MKYVTQILGGLAVATLLAGCSTSRTGASNYHCSLTGKDLAECCCTKKEGKLYCNEAQKFVDPCCCAKIEHKM